MSNLQPNIDPLHLAIALGPLAAYFLLLGLVNLSRRALVTTATRDVFALGIAVSGLVIAGPMELFLPEAAAWQFGSFVWVLLLSFYFLCLTLISLLLRPRIIVYNQTRDETRQAVESVARELDSDGRWDGDSLLCPNLRVHLHIETFGAVKNVQLVSSGAEQSFNGWKKLELSLRDHLAESSGTPNLYGMVLMAFGIMMAGMVGVYLVNDPQTVAQSLKEMLRF